MNQLDILPQNMPRRAEGPPTRSSPAPESKEGGRGSFSDGDFSSLLNQLTDGVRQDDASGLPRSADSIRLEIEITLEHEAAKADLSSEPDRSVSDLLQTVLTEEPSNSAVPAQTAVQAGGSILSVLEGLLPRILNQEDPTSGPRGEQAGSLPLRSGLERLGQESEGITPLGTSPGSKLKLSVQHQETHFRPVVEELSLKTAAQDMEVAEGQAVASGDGSPVKDSNDIQLKEARGKGLAAPASDMLPVKPHPATETQTNTEEPAPRHEAVHPEISKPSREANGRTDGSVSLPPATLHRLAGAIMAEIKPLAAELNSRAPIADSAARLMSTRASEGVLRVLHLQLHPAELGLVTIKMRLAGDSLEMEIQASSEETAQMLRSDSEKISSLLRGSGYRPDTISIHAGQPEAAQQDGAFSQRQQATSQSQQQTFHHGASNQEGRSRHQGDRYESERARVHNDASEDSTSLARSTGGIYL